MGKKKIKKQTEEELLKEGAKIQGVEKPSELTSAKSSRRIIKGKFFIQVSYNNTSIVVADDKGDVLAWSSAGSLGFKGPKKATPYAASKVAEAVLEKVKKVDFAEVEIFVRGIGSGRESAVRALVGHGLNVILIKDTTPAPHNGPRPKKVRRV
ncbi:MAG: 30S ribosomal protein S11 [Patescibacteria group bacterium]